MRKFITTLTMLFLLVLPVSALAKGVVLNFTDVDISTMVKFISDLTGKNFVMDDRVKGKISVFSPAKLTTEEAYNVFTSVLELKGFTVVQAGKVLKIIPTGAAKQSGMNILSGKERSPVNEAYLARIITLENISSQEAMSFLQPLISKDAYISAFGPGNMLLLVDSSINIQKILNILHLVDTDQKREGAELVFLKNASAENAAAVIRDWLGGKDKGGRPAGQAAPTGGSTVLADTRLNALILFGNSNDKQDIKRLINQIDVAPPTTSSKVNVYYLENADATEIAKVLDGVVRGSSAAATAPGQPGAAAAPQQSPFEGGKITITPDKTTNSLVIMASPTDYQNLLQVVQKLDRRNRQVFVQAMIAEVSLDRAKELGLQWGMLGVASDGKYASVVGQYDPNNVLSSFLAAATGETPSGLGSLLNLSGTPMNFAVVLRALQSNGALNVLSTPNIMTSDNKEAEIFVGENVPFITSTTAYNTGVAQTSNVERKDTGITLKIKPMISEGEYVKLDIYQEISAVKDALNKGAAADITTTKRSAKTSVVVKNTDTVVIGGLIQDQDQETISKIPLLGDIPLLGWLFKAKSMKRTKTNLMIILTPYIIKDSVDMGKVSEMQKNRFSEQLKSDKPIDFDKELKVKVTE